jgi:hypothetical protein
MSGRFGTRAIPSDQIGRITDVLDSQQNVLQRDRLILFDPAERSREAFIFCEGGTISACCFLTEEATRPATKAYAPSLHTEKVLHQRPVSRPSFRVSERDDRRCQLAKAELLHCGGESIRRIESTGVDLADELAVRELFGGEDAGGPEFLRSGEDGGVVEVVVAVVGVYAALQYGVRFGFYFILGGCG